MSGKSPSQNMFGVGEPVGARVGACEGEEDVGRNVGDPVVGRVVGENVVVGRLVGNADVG
jgi:hypothetical protein